MMAKKRIAAFRGTYHFLSNFYYCQIEFAGHVYPSVEHAFQAAKTKDPVKRRHIREAETAGLAKYIGRRVVLRRNWDKKRVSIMRKLVHKKFKNHHLRKKLLATNGAQLIEGNNWGDTFWGECPLGTGRNELGKILMAERKDLAK
jgi:ribA/ribD-fused uncharacterized protein